MENREKGVQSSCQNCPNSKAVLTTDLVLVITEATELGFGCTLYHFEAKTKVYISYEDINTQFARYRSELNTVRGKIQKRSKILGLEQK